MPGELNRVSAGGCNVWGVNDNHDIYQYNDGGWINIPGKLVEISCAADGTVCGVNAADQIFQYNRQDQSWHAIVGSLIQIVVANNNLFWGVNRHGNIFWCDSSHEWHMVCASSYFVLLILLYPANFSKILISL